MEGLGRCYTFNPFKFSNKDQAKFICLFLASRLSYFGQSTAESQHLIPYTAVDNTECKSVVRQVM